MAGDYTQAIAKLAEAVEILAMRTRHEIGDNDAADCLSLAREAVECAHDAGRDDGE